MDDFNQFGSSSETELVEIIGGGSMDEMESIYNENYLEQKRDIEEIQNESSPEPERVEVEEEKTNDDNLQLIVDIDRIMHHQSQMVHTVDALRKQFDEEKNHISTETEEELDFEIQYNPEQVNQLQSAPFNKEKKQNNNDQQLEGDKETISTISGMEDDNTYTLDTDGGTARHIDDETMDAIEAVMDTPSVPKCSCLVLNPEDELDAVIPPKTQYLNDIMIYLVTLYGLMYYFIDFFDLEDDAIAVVVIWVIFGMIAGGYLGIMLVLKYMYNKIKNKEISLNMIILMVKLLLTSTMPFSYYAGYKKLFEALVIISAAFLVIIFLRVKGSIKNNICFICLLFSILCSIVAVLCYFLFF